MKYIELQQIENNYNNITIQIKQLEQKKKKVAQIKINNKYSKEDIIEAIQDIYVDCNKLEIHINIMKITIVQKKRTFG